MKNGTLKVIIPALKKNVAFQDDLVKKLLGITLIQRSINKALNLGVEAKDIFLMTDSEEIRIIGDRNNVNTFWNADLSWEKYIYGERIWSYLQNITDKSDYIIFLSPYAPLIEVSSILQALNDFIDSKENVLKPFHKVSSNFHAEGKKNSFDTLFADNQKSYKIESKSFILLTGEFFINDFQSKVKILEWPIGFKVFEIKSQQDWWVCEKMLGRKRIIFRVIGNKNIGSGHIFRALSIAHEITDHEILFVCDDQNDVAISILKNCNYWLGVYELELIINGIIDLKPNLVINDILSSNEGDILPLKQLKIKTINFEDLGPGGKLSDLTINELYDSPLYNSKNTLWGHHFFFVRDEFNGAKVHIFKNNVKKIMLSFGGTDQHNLSYKVYKIIKNICTQKGIEIHIVIGSGYRKYKDLEKSIKGNPDVFLTRGTGVISSIMEQCELAIVSNGRTVYELAHMNIPSIVISQHQREAEHTFASEDNGFLNLGIYSEFLTNNLIKKNLIKLIDDSNFRNQLFNNISKFNFYANKQKVINKIDNLLI